MSLVTDPIDDAVAYMDSHSAPVLDIEAKRLFDLVRLDNTIFLVVLVILVTVFAPNAAWSCWETQEATYLVPMVLAKEGVGVST